MPRRFRIWRGNGKTGVIRRKVSRVSLLTKSMGSLRFWNRVNPVERCVTRRLSERHPTVGRTLKVPGLNRNPGESGRHAPSPPPMPSDPLRDHATAKSLATRRGRDRSRCPHGEARGFKGAANAGDRRDDRTRRAAARGAEATPEGGRRGYPGAASGPGLWDRSLPAPSPIYSDRRRRVAALRPKASTAARTQRRRSLRQGHGAPKPGDHARIARFPRSAAIRARRRPTPDAVDPGHDAKIDAQSGGDSARFRFRLRYDGPSHPCESFRISV